jgi:hypothetical protein
VSSNSVWLETRCVLMERVTVSSSSTSIVQGFLQDCISSIFANTPISTYKKEPFLLTLWEKRKERHRSSIWNMKSIKIWWKTK